MTTQQQRQQNHAPSAERRKLLKERERKDAATKNLMKVLDTYPIEKYYTMSDRLLQAFELAFDERRLDDAYVFGLRYATFGLEGLPKHCRYNSEGPYKRLKNKHSRRVELVLQKLDSVASRMDAEELRLAKRRKEIALSRQRHAEDQQKQQQQQLQKEADKKRHHQAILQQQREELIAHQQQAMQQSALDKLKKLNQQQQQTTTTTSNNPAPAATQSHPPQQERQPANTTTLKSATTGHHTKKAVAKQKQKEKQLAAAREQAEREAAAAASTEALKKKQQEQEKQEAAYQKLLSQHKQNKKKQQQQTSASSAPAKPVATKQTSSRTIEQPSKLDPNALAQVNQLKEEISKHDNAHVAAKANANKTNLLQPALTGTTTTTTATTKDYKTEFAKYQAEWNTSSKNKPPAVEEKSSGPQQLSSLPPPTQKSNRNVAVAAPTTLTPTSKTASYSVPPPHHHYQHQHQHQQPPSVVVSSNKNASSTKALRDSLNTTTTMMATAAATGAKSTLKMLSSLSPKRNSTSTKQVMPAEEEGFELKMTDSGPEVVVEEENDHHHRSTTKLTPSEAKTIRMLENAIQLQEKRLQVLESSPERASLRVEAKHRLKHGDRKGALHCLAKKKRINQTIEVVKHAIFNMETQIIMLESAIENREVNKIMKEASDVMNSYQGGILRVGDFTDERLGEVLSAVGVQGSNNSSLENYDEEELLSELHEGGEEEEGVKANKDDDDDIDSLLSLPSAPHQEPCPIPNELPKNESDAVSRIIASLF